MEDITVIDSPSDLPAKPYLQLVVRQFEKDARYFGYFVTDRSCSGNLNNLLPEMAGFSLFEEFSQPGVTPRIYNGPGPSVDSAQEYLEGDGSRYQFRPYNEDELLWVKAALGIAPSSELREKFIAPLMQHPLQIHSQETWGGRTDYRANRDIAAALDKRVQTLESRIASRRRISKREPWPGTVDRR